MRSSSLHLYPQAVTSRNTCRRQIAGVYAAALPLLPARAKVLDFGGGRFEQATDFMRKHRCALHVYDPYNRSADHNDGALSHAPFDAIICANVLNVLTDDVLPHAIRDLALVAREANGTNAPVFVAVYERNRSGRGEMTGTDQWQRNERLGDYLRPLKRRFVEVAVVGKMLVCRRPTP